MVVLGIDPGTSRIGFGVIECGGNRYHCIEYGIVKNSPADLPAQTGKIANLRATSDFISRLIKKYKPERVGIEKLFFAKNLKTVVPVSEMRGVIMLTVSDHMVPVFEFTPLQVKQAVSGYGNAGKTQVEKMVRMILGLEKQIKPDDAADALAIAICCANTIVR